MPVPHAGGPLLLNPGSGLGRYLHALRKAPVQLCPGPVFANPLRAGWVGRGISSQQCKLRHGASYQRATLIQCAGLRSGCNADPHVRGPGILG
jgi:hypothetical protein